MAEGLYRRNGALGSRTGSLKTKAFEQLFRRSGIHRNPTLEKDRGSKPMTYYKYSHFLMYEDGPEYEETYKGGYGSSVFRHLLLRSLRRKHHGSSLAAAAAT